MDLREELYQFVGDLPEEAWFEDETLTEFGNPYSLAGHAMEQMLDNLGDPESYMTLEPGHMNPRENDPWDVFYLQAVDKLAREVAPHLLDTTLNVEVKQYSLDGGIMRVDLDYKNSNGIPPHAHGARPPRKF